MSGDTKAQWTTDWLETLDGDRLRELACALFSRIGYRVAPMEQYEELDFELSQEAPMAPRVGLSCRSESEGVEIPMLRKVDAAVSQNDHGFGIVAKNGSFRPEEKMFAQGKPLQLIDSEEFVKRLAQLPSEDQEALREEFRPAALSGSADDPAAPSGEGSTGTPDFIKKLENMPGFGNKKERAGDPAQPAAASAEPAPAPGTKPASPQKEPVTGLDLTKDAATPSPGTPAGNSAPSPAPALQPLGQSLSPSSPGNATPAPPSESSAAPPMREPDPDPVADAGSPAAPETAPPGQPAAPPMREPDPDPVADAGSPAAPETAPPVQPAAPPMREPDPDPVANAKPPAAEESAPAESATPAAPPSPNPSAMPETTEPTPASATAAEEATPPVPAESPQQPPSQPEPSSDDSASSDASADPTASGPDSEGAPKFPAGGVPASGSGSDASAFLAGLQPSDASASAGTATPPPIPPEAAQAGKVAEAEEEVAPPAKKRKKSSPGKRSLVGALVVLLLLLIPVAGGFYAFKIIFGSKEKEVVVVETPPQLKLPPIDQGKIDELSAQLAERIGELRLVTSEIEGREAAARVAMEATDARKVGIDFVERGGDDLVGSINAVIRGEVFEDPSHPQDGTRFGFLNLGGVGIDAVANFLFIEDGLLKFTMDARDPSLLGGGVSEGASGAELLQELESVLNHQHVVGARNNAKTLAEIAKAAKNAGLDFTAAGRRNVEKTVSAIVNGETVANYLESGEDAFFGFPDLSEKAQRAAVSYLAFDQGELTYVREPDPAPKPAFDLIGKDLLYDLERGNSIAEKAVEHVKTRIPAIEAAVAELDKKQEAILAVTGEPEAVPFGGGTMSLLLPRDFAYEMEDEDTLLVTLKYSPNKDAAWLRIRLQSRETIAGPNGEMGVDRLRSLAKSLGRPIERLEDKVFYWKNDEVLEGDLLYWVTTRQVGFGNSIVQVADATAKGMENLPEVERLQEVLPGIIGSLSETGKPRQAMRAADASEPSAPAAPREKPELPGRALSRQ